MHKENRRNLDKAIDELKELKAPDIWYEIANDLDFAKDENLISAIEDLKDSEAPDIWLPIEASLPKPKFRSKLNWSIAASVSILFVSAFLFYKSLSDSASETISYSTEEVDFFETSLDISLDEGDEDKILDYVKKNCRRLSQTCQNPEFKGLLEAYIELADAKKQLENELSKGANQPQLMKYLIRVEKNQTQVGKDMLKKLRLS
ncbi:MAG: hypothetical protein AAGG59_19225 [Bacteroidota bacterium]